MNSIYNIYTYIIYYILFNITIEQGREGELEGEGGGGLVWFGLFLCCWEERKKLREERIKKKNRKRKKIKKRGGGETYRNIQLARKRKYYNKMKEIE